MTEDEVFDNNDDLKPAESPLSSDDVEFVIDEWSLLDEEATGADPMDDLFDSPHEVEAAAAGRRVFDADLSKLQRTTTQEEDSLFEAVSEIPVNELAEDRVFDEASASDWAGKGIEIEDLGVPMTGEDATVASSETDDGMFDIDADEDLILIDSEADMVAAEFSEEGSTDDYTVDFADSEDETELPTTLAGDGVTSDEAMEDGEFDADESGEAGDPGTDYNTIDFDREGTPQGEWAPVASEYDDEEEYDEDENAEEKEEAYDDEEVDADYSEYEEVYYDETDSDGGGTLRRSRAPMLLAAAAMMMIAAAGGLWYFKTELFGTNGKVNQIDVIKIDRPKVANVGPTVNPKDPTKDPRTNTDPVAKDPKIGTDPIAKDPANDPKIGTDPVAKDPANDPKIGTDPVAKDPVNDPKVNPDPIAKDPASDPRIGTDPAAMDLANDPLKTYDPNLRPDGGTLQIGGMDETMDSSGGADLMERHLRSVVQSIDGLEMGTRALAQLRNENIFVGRVKALNSVYVTLATKDGEVTLPRKDLRALTNLDFDEYEDWQKATKMGLIKLRNSNRLKGKIVEARDDSVILMVNSNRVIIPRSAIESVTEERQNVNTVSDEMIENDDWFRALVEQRIKSHDENRAQQSAEIRARATRKSSKLELEAPLKPTSKKNQ